jgi:protein-tyrosine phosphatase
MRQVAGYALWLGNAGDLQDARLVMTAGIEAVVELADSDQLAVLPRELIRFRFPLADGGDNPPWLLRIAAESVATVMKSGVPILVCCSAGMSRSVCIVAGAVALIEGVSLVEAVAAVVASGPADVAPQLFKQLQRVLGE